MIDLQNIEKIYSNNSVETPAVNGVSFKIKPGEFVAIMGRSGSGKSSLMHIMGFLDTATKGVYKFNGKNVAQFSDNKLAEIRNKKIGFVFQAFNLLPRISVLDNVRLPLDYTSLSLTKKNNMAKNAINMVGLLKRINYMPNQLSGGEKQRVAIARAIVNNPAIIFADEPTGNLDSKSSKQIMNIFEDLHKHGNTIVLVTHEKEIAEYSDRIIYIQDGIIKSDKKIHK